MTIAVEHNWKVVTLHEDGEVHVIPQNDLRDHEESTTCWCQPHFDDGVIVHNSMDQRELFERGERKPS
jgi:hypothetical protein